jgi:hypothetical protein
VSDIEQRISPGRAIEYVCLWAICAGSLLLWFALDADFENALWWAWKMPGSFGGTVRLDKVVICLSWSVMVLSGIAWRYDLVTAKVLLFLGLALLVQLVVSIVQVGEFAIFHITRPTGSLMTAFGILMLLLVAAKIAIPAILAYRLVVRPSLPQKHVAIAVALTLSACGVMIWIGLLDVIHPGITWRSPVIRG